MDWRTPTRPIPVIMRGRDAAHDQVRTRVCVTLRVRVCAYGQYVHVRPEGISVRRLQVYGVTHAATWYWH
jgi:hypothetical protein